MRYHDDDDDEAMATMIGCLPTQAIAFEWKPGLTVKQTGAPGRRLPARCPEHHAAAADGV